MRILEQVAREVVEIVAIDGDVKLVRYREAPCERLGMRQRTQRIDEQPGKVGDVRPQSGDASSARTGAGKLAFHVAAHEFDLPFDVGRHLVLSDPAELPAFCSHDGERRLEPMGEIGGAFSCRLELAALTFEKRISFPRRVA